MQKSKGYVPLFVELCDSLDSRHNRSTGIYLSETTVRIWSSLPPILIRHWKTTLFIKWWIQVSYMNIQIDVTREVGLGLFQIKTFRGASKETT